jgi:polyhydroxyalkanoate synthesis regulator phasin
MMARMPGREAMQAQQEAFLKAMTGGMAPTSAPTPSRSDAPEEGEDLDAIRKQLAELQDKLSKLDK